MSKLYTADDMRRAYDLGRKVFDIGVPFNKSLDELLIELGLRQDRPRVQMTGKRRVRV